MIETKGNRCEKVNFVSLVHFVIESRIFSTQIKFTENPEYRNLKIYLKQQYLNSIEATEYILMICASNIPMQIQKVHNNFLNLQDFKKKKKKKKKKIDLPVSENLISSTHSSPIHKRRKTSNPIAPYLSPTHPHPKQETPHNYPPFFPSPFTPP